MPNSLHDTLARYFTAASVHDSEAMSALFASVAVVRDEGREHRGLPAIRRWMQETFEKYDYTVEPQASEERDGKWVVTGLVSGTFPGSPVSIRYEFTLEDGKITRLDIG
jgi:hypothetical protein